MGIRNSNNLRAIHLIHLKSITLFGHYFMGCSNKLKITAENLYCPYMIKILPIKMYPFSVIAVELLWLITIRLFGKIHEITREE